MTRMGRGVGPAVVIATLPLDAAAQGERASKREVEELLAWQAQSPESTDFEGGAPPTALWIGLGIVCVFVIVYYWLFVEPGKIKPGS